ncbi:hypothetical protein E4U16_007961 [Claviceps sp. LM84 group G4]|nr:hypothetical protein E4U33_000233 [Claviceps sp. LM78 group G4]KAG6068441.1 hypothetical protein E4U16_007961 [Claviceps sp. LM84 group G4]
MGLDSRKPPPLPAPTETDSTMPSELGTDISKPGDEKSSYSIPEDGSPVTIRTRGHRANKSQTSLLIEYFEGGKSSSGQDRKPSVRVRLTPSRKSKGDHIQVTESKSTRKAALTRRIPLDQAIASREIELRHGEDVNSTTSCASATEESNISRNPIDIEIDRSQRRRRPASPLIPSSISYHPGNASEISAIPHDSFLDGTVSGGEPRRSSSPFRGESIVTAAAAAAATNAEDEISSNKTRSKDRTSPPEKSKDKTDRKRQSSNKPKSSIVAEQKEDAPSPRSRHNRSHLESNTSAVDSSAVSSHLPPSHRSLDSRSIRSGASKSSSINNPKLLETVEDAIRRLILPELSALKREQSKRESRRGSISSSATSVSRDDAFLDRRRSSGQRPESATSAGKRKERRNREARHEYDDASLHSPSHDSIAADHQIHHRHDALAKQGSNLLKVAAAGAAGAALTKGKAPLVNDTSDSTDRKSRDRRRRRAEHTRSRSLGRNMFDEDIVENDDENKIDDDDYDIAPAPPMPLMSDINPSELTRTSILSAESDRSRSANGNVVAPTLGTLREEATPSGASTPTGVKSPIDHARHAMAMQHANVSHGDLTALPRGTIEQHVEQEVDEHVTDEYGRRILVSSYDEYGGSGEALGQAALQEDDIMNRYFSTQDVPPPLRYVPYQAFARGLSPIQSVSGYTEAGSETPLPQNAADMPSPNKTPERARQHRSLQPDGPALRDVRDDYDQLTDAADQSEDTSRKQAVRGIGASPHFVHPAIGVESAVASLIDGSMLDQSVVTGASGYDHNVARDSTLSYNEPFEPRSNGGPSSVVKADVEADVREVEEDGPATLGAKSGAQYGEHSEYDVDEYGNKIPQDKSRQSTIESEAAITAGAVGAAAAALRAAKESRQEAATRGPPEEGFQPAGVARNRSFKERTIHQAWEPRTTPTHSIDRLGLESSSELGTTSRVPDLQGPTSGNGHIDEELQTNPSMMEAPLDGEPIHGGDRSGRATPTQHDFNTFYEDESHESKIGRGGLGISEDVGATALGAAAGMVDAHPNDDMMDTEEDDWVRTSDDRKRDTLLTNPYEDTSPIADPQLDETLLGARGVDTGFNTMSSGFYQKYDEGYMSNGPIRTPDVPQSKGKAVDYRPAVAEDEDPFYTSNSHGHHLGAMSRGMASPFYDAATGAGMDGIENKDIVALMQHLMVRDAQRSARDTEIVALLMNAALEMRNSFREMKELVQDTGDDVIFSSVENTEKLQKAINGPRPYPSGSASRSFQSPSYAGTLDENGIRKKNLWKRALQGLSNKGSNDLGRIEDMMMHLLGEVDVLKMQTARPGSRGGLGQSYENPIPGTQYEDDKEYEAEGSPHRINANQPAAATATAGQSGRPGSLGGGDIRRVSERRISPVPESQNEDEDENVKIHQYDESRLSLERSAGDYLQTPTRVEQIQRGGSVPLETPPRLAPAAEPQPLSAENTPRSGKGKKSKSSSLSWLPRISRWSGTTASSVGKALRGSGASKKAPKNDDYLLPATRTGSSFSCYDGLEVYEPESYAQVAAARGQARPSSFHGPAPLSQSQYASPEDPKYKAHRNSLNLQHPQPRPGQTERFRTALESSAQDYNTNPMTPRSADWAGSATSLNRLPPNRNRLSRGSSVHGPDTDDCLSSPGQPSCSANSPQSLKEAVESPGAPTSPKSSRLSTRQQDAGSPAPQQSSESGYGTLTATYMSHYSGSSPKLENRNLNAALGVPSRRPTGPRAMTPKSPDDAARGERRRKRDTFGMGISNDADMES